MKKPIKTAESMIMIYRNELVPAQKEDSGVEVCAIGALSSSYHFW